MATVPLSILQPVNGARIAGTADVRLQGAVTQGSAAGLFFKWFSTLNPVATSDHPELNAADHSAAKLDWTTPLDVGTHVITLAAADREGSDLPSVKAVTRAGLAGGAASPANPKPCVVHRLYAELRTPAADGANMSRASATIEMRAPFRWAKETVSGSGVYVPDADYQAVNGIRYRFRWEPYGVTDPSRTAEVTPAAGALAFFVASGKTWLRWTGALPGNLGNGAYVLTLFVETLDGAVNHSVARRVTLTA